jgi:valyl-tRNA synthetase
LEYFRYILQSVEEVKLLKANRLPKLWLTNGSWANYATMAVVNQSLDKSEFSYAAEKLQEFTWTDFADWYLEIAKVEDAKDEILLYILQNILKLWHPFCHS